MTVVAVDTGFTKARAEAVTRAVRRAHDVDLTNLATKTDLAETKADILQWMVGAIGLRTVMILGAVVALARLLPH
jgi:hypothetical protein